MKALFIGAGAAYDCGMPLVWELTAELRRCLTPERIVSFNEGWKAQGGGWNQDVISRVAILLGNKDLHYEHIIGALEIEFSRERNEGKRQDYHAALGFLLQAVYGLLMERQVKNTDYALNALDDFSAIKKLAQENNPLWIFSLNHDCIIEMLAASAGIPIKSGFNEEVSIPMKSTDGVLRQIPFERLSRASIESNCYDFHKHGEYGINLIKLHGGLDLFGQNDELNYLKIKPVEHDPAPFAHQLQIIDKINQDIAVRDGVACMNENVYEDEQGRIQFLRKTLLSGAHKFTKKLSQIAPSEFLSLFKGSLNYADALVCIGYSFGDKHIDENIVDWLSLSGSRKLTIVNPGIGGCPDRLKYLSEQVECNPIGAAEYFIQVSDDKPTEMQSILRKERSVARDRIRRELTE
ncbi:hypothetical protein [Halomonas stenophila]|uniref:SIR2-like domain-containing protein n=1 Tax=Halomonas stenophila TaxID=795312 RepID=A0A7W5EVI9_9GAMM|nr:hypothetical protein [Halomonas stenophila]MBB3231125.1 hypothetical protein [Halomonas stenophila]